MSTTDRPHRRLFAPRATRGNSFGGGPEYVQFDTTARLDSVLAGNFTIITLAKLLTGSSGSELPSFFNRGQTGGGITRGLLILGDNTGDVVLYRSRGNGTRAASVLGAPATVQWEWIAVTLAGSSGTIWRMGLRDGRLRSATDSVEGSFTSSSDEDGQPLLFNGWHTTGPILHGLSPIAFSALIPGALNAQQLRAVFSSPESVRRRSVFWSRLGEYRTPINEAGLRGYVATRGTHNEIIGTTASIVTNGAPFYTRTFRPVFPWGNAAAVSLVVADASCASSAANVALTQHNVLAVAAASCASSAENAALTQHNTLSAANATSASVAESVALTQHHALVVGNATSASTAQNVTLGGITLSVADAACASSAESPTLTPGLAVAATVAASSADGVSLTQHNVLTVGNAVCISRAANVALVTGDGPIYVPTLALPYVRVKVLDTTPRLTLRDTTPRLTERATTPTLRAR